MSSWPHIFSRWDVEGAFVRMVDQVDDGNATEERDVGTVWG